MDLLTPLGKGQRALIVAPPRTGKTILLQQISQAITANYPEVKLFVLLVDERPEEVTDMRRSVQGEVIASSLDRDVESHVRLSQLVVERCKRLVEMGRTCSCSWTRSRVWPAPSTSGWAIPAARCRAAWISRRSTFPRSCSPPRACSRKGAR